MKISDTTVYNALIGILCRFPFFFFGTGKRHTFPHGGSGTKTSVFIINAIRYRKLIYDTRHHRKKNPVFDFVHGQSFIRFEGSGISFAEFIFYIQTFF